MHFKFANTRACTCTYRIVRNDVCHMMAYVRVTKYQVIRCGLVLVIKNHDVGVVHSR